MSDSYWKSPIDASADPQTITLESLNKAFEKMQERAEIAHGSKGDPHVVSPRGGFCECGRYFTKEEVGYRE